MYIQAERNSCEVDYVADNGEIVVPVEVNAEVNLKAKGLKSYCEKYSPNVAIRTAMTDFKREERPINLPPYAVGILSTIMENPG